MNKVQLLGRITADIQVKYGSANQTAVARFTLAVDDGYGEKKHTNFISCVAFGKTAEGLEMYVGKGCRIALEGKIQTGSYEKNDGSKVYTTDVIADRVEYIDFRDKQNTQTGQTDFAGFQQIDEICPF